MYELYDLRENFLYYNDFYLTAKEKSYSEASRKHNISQSSLTRSISKLEKLLDLKLVNTSNKGFELTLDGERLYNYLNQFFSSIHAFTSKDLASNLDVTLTIGTTRNIADFTLPKYLSKFNKLYPEIKVNVFTDSATNLNEFLLQHKIDVLIDYLPNINFSEKLEFVIQPIGYYNTCFACSKKYYEIIKDSLHTLSDLNNYSLVISGSSRRRQMLDEVLQNNNVKLTPNIQLPDSKLMADFVKDNDYIGYFIKDEINTYDLKEIELANQMPINSIGIIYSRNSLNPIAEHFVEIVNNMKE